MNNTMSTLADFGWTHEFAAQLPLDGDPEHYPVRVIAVDRDRLRVVGPSIARTVAPWQQDGDDESSRATVGDWLLFDLVAAKPVRLLQRKSLLSRRAPGADSRTQLIAANVDTLLIVSSCNQDFNLARLERYLAVALEASVAPIVVLTKADQCEAPSDYVQIASRLLPGLLVETLDARQASAATKLQPWCARGQTVALLGSSGVGKSTLVNTLSGQSQAATQAIREADAKGRHTTTRRMLHRLPQGGWLLDTPGMRELQLSDAEAGIADVFSDIVSLASACRFADCQHRAEPGCAVQRAIDDGTLDATRLQRWRKLEAENRHNTESIAERRLREKNLAKIVKDVTKNRRP